MEDLIFVMIEVISEMISCGVKAYKIILVLAFFIITIGCLWAYQA